MILAVIDTNVLVSALLVPSGNEAAVIELIRDGMVRPCVSPPMVIEYTGVLGRSKFDKVRGTVAGLVDLMLTSALHVVPEQAPFTSPDPKDQAFLDCAVACAVDYIVTGNWKDFPDRFYGRTEVLNGRGLLDRLETA